VTAICQLSTTETQVFSQHFLGKNEAHRVERALREKVNIATSIII
jgi:hypothetical protein